MDDTIEIILAFLLSVIVFFIFPIYVAFEKKDDLAYALATKYVSDFVEEVKIKGYISADMYTNLEEKLLATDNTFDIYMEHRAKKVYPDGNKGYKEVEEIYTEKQIFDVIGKVTTEGVKIVKEEKDYLLFRNISDEAEILSLEAKGINYITSDDYSSETIENIPLKANMFYISSNKNVEVTELEEDADRKEHNSPIYVMNIGDEFNIRIKNTNVSLAAMLFNSFSTDKFGSDTTRIYVNYGGVITAEKYW